MKPNSLFLLLFFLFAGDGLVTPTNACNKNKTVQAAMQKTKAAPAFTELIPFNHMLL
ncbi:hypothetical protein [Lacibacter luteus]|uniref:hypothetical protein n=1 Tax=Lacibacter luteus TaxID=2508719 RepID=UPI0013E979B0|nr:hypothetical protein [Lacibacter luteus]